MVCACPLCRDDGGKGLEQEGHWDCGVELVAVRMVNEVVLLLRKVPGELGDAVSAWVVDGGWAGCKEHFHRLNVVEVQDIVCLLTGVAADEEGTQCVVALRDGVGEDGCEDVAAGPSVLASWGVDPEGHWSEGTVSVKGFWDGPSGYQGVCVMGDVELVWFEEGEEE